MLISLQGYYFVAAAYGADEAGKAAGVKIDARPTTTTNALLRVTTSLSSGGSWSCSTSS
jgi:hypothetical protein